MFGSPFRARLIDIVARTHIAEGGRNTTYDEINSSLLLYTSVRNISERKPEMESDLTKRRPSIIPGWLPGLPSGWTPTVDAVDESPKDDAEFAHKFFASNLVYLPSVTNYETKPYLTIKKFNLNNQASMSMAHTHGVCVLNTEGEQVIACDHYNNRLLMFDSNDGHLLEIFRGDMATPECVASRPHYQQQIYITKAHSISLYDLEKKQTIQKLGCEEGGHANNRFSSPGGISVDATNG